MARKITLRTQCWQLEEKMQDCSARRNESVLGGWETREVKVTEQEVTYAAV